MNLGPSPILILNQDCETTAEALVNELQSQGFHVIRSFNLKDVKNILSTCNCPHHGTDQCSCQVMVLLVFSSKGSPATLVIHGYDESTTISLVDIPEQRVESHMRNDLIRHLNASNRIIHSPLT